MSGRGGAGNILRAQQQSKKVAEDVEANTTASSAPALTPATSTSTSQSQEYAHTGRGGAGNWYQPSQLEKEGNFTNSSDATAQPTSAKPQVSTPWHPDSQELPVGRAGRGGAGNFVWKDEDKEKAKRELEEKRKDKVSEGVEKDVEAGLAKPPGALLGSEKTGRGW